MNDIRISQGKEGLVQVEREFPTEPEETQVKAMENITMGEENRKQTKENPMEAISNITVSQGKEEETETEETLVEAVDNRNIEGEQVDVELPTDGDEEIPRDFYKMMVLLASFALQETLDEAMENNSTSEGEEETESEEETLVEAMENMTITEEEQGHVELPTKQEDSGKPANQTPMEAINNITISEGEDETDTEESPTEAMGNIEFPTEIPIDLCKVVLLATSQFFAFQEAQIEAMESITVTERGQAEVEHPTETEETPIKGLENTIITEGEQVDVELPTQIPTEIVMNKSTITSVYGAEEDDEILKGLSGIMSKLPLDSIFEILSRLPIKSLSQCRWVSKAWYKIIRHPGFAKMQHAWASKNFSHCMTFCHIRRKEFYLVDHEVFDNHEASVTVHNARFDGFERILEVVGACNGLLCLAPDALFYRPSPYYVCNPVTGESVNLILSPLHEDEPAANGFGFDPFNDEYKVIRIMRSLEVEIFTLGSDNWRKISNMPCEFVRNNAVCVSGALHWYTQRDIEMGVSIISLDLATEQFNKIAPPPGFVKNVNQTFHFRINLGVLGGCLCFIAGEIDRDCVVWVMKSYGVSKSWSKAYVFEMESMIQAWPTAYEVLKLKNGELVLETNKKFLNYFDPKKKIYKNIKTRGIPLEDGNIFVLRTTHVGSLVSPKNIGTSGKRRLTTRGIVGAMVPEYNSQSTLSLELEL